jgi:amidase
MIEMGVDVVYPVELPNQSGLTIDGKNCFEPVVCKLLRIDRLLGIY